jgi:hypothetical protein
LKPRIAFAIVFTTVIVTSAICQKSEDNPWHLTYGVTKDIFNPLFNAYSLRTFSPRFKVQTRDEYWTEEEEKHPAQFKNYRFLFEFTYAPAYSIAYHYNKYSPTLHFKNVTQYQLSGNILKKIYQYKVFSIEWVGGMQLFFVTNPDYGLINYQRFYRCYIGSLMQFDLGMISPFMDIGMNFIYRVDANLVYTVGTKLSLSPIYKGLKRKYKLRLKKENE